MNWFLLLKGLRIGLVFVFPLPSQWSVAVAVAAAVVCPEVGSWAGVPLARVASGASFGG
jgi:hypothetical protein